MGSLLAGLGWGGALASGQADPLYWCWAVAIAVALLALGARWIAPGRGMFLFAFGLMGAVGAVLLFCGRAGGHMVPTVAPMDVPASREKLGLLSGPDLFWEKKAPAVSWLERSFEVRPLDGTATAQVEGVRHLLLVQPRALPSKQLVTLDSWVREGGRAVILADPLLLWPDGPSPGDRRRAPVRNQLGPLLAHWGLALVPFDREHGARVQRRFLTGGALLPVAGASGFDLTGRGAGARCVLAEAGLMALCRIGRGEVRLVADADLIDDRLWLADPDHPGSRGALSGDTMALIERWLREPLKEVAGSPLAANWIRDDLALIAGVRWALIFGMGWAVLGGVVLSSREKRGKNG